ncbi:hypothetical protein [Sorangium sp. So ce1151]|uniref:hypothetical protein n=1 Tax=Sorangium sp. So ce1151 TaxID=3133332 RepID=UPI003F62B913
MPALGVDNGRTYRRADRGYGAEVIGGRGAPALGQAEDAPARYVDYGRKAAAGAEALPGAAKVSGRVAT